MLLPGGRVWYHFLSGPIFLRGNLVPGWGSGPRAGGVVPGWRVWSQSNGYSPRVKVGGGMVPKGEDMDPGEVVPPPPNYESERYASYWNAILFYLWLIFQCKKRNFGLR